MAEWEYKKVHFNQLTDFYHQNTISVENLNKLGSKGWELVTITSWIGNPAFAYFKREKQYPKLPNSCKE